MPNLECHVCGSTDDVRWADWYGEEVPLCYECRSEFNTKDYKHANDDDFEYDDYVPL